MKVSLVHGSVRNREIAGSNPATLTKMRECHRVWPQPSKLTSAGSSPVSRSNYLPPTRTVVG